MSVNQVPKIIRENRIKKGLTQKQLAEMLGYKRDASVQQWESGRQNVPAKTIRRLAEILEIDLNRLLP